jgi:protease I
VNPADYAALVIPGGRAPEYIRNHSDCQKIVRHFFEQQKPVAQLCHAGLVLAACGVLKGRRSAAYPALEPDIQAAGAEFVNAEAVVDGAMVSARAWPDHPAWMRAFVRLLKQSAPARELETAA